MPGVAAFARLLQAEAAATLPAVTAGRTQARHPFSVPDQPGASGPRNHPLGPRRMRRQGRVVSGHFGTRARAIEMRVASTEKDRADVRPPSACLPTEGEQQRTQSLLVVALRRFETFLDDERHDRER